MILRLKGVITHDHNTKLPREDGESTAAGWGIKPSPKEKPFEEDPEEAPTRGWGNRPNPRKDPNLAHGWGNRPNPKKESHIRRRGRRTGPRKVNTHLTVHRDQTRGSGDMVDGYSYGRSGAAMKDRSMAACPRYQVTT